MMTGTGKTELREVLGETGFGKAARAAQPGNNSGSCFGPVNAAAPAPQTAAQASDDLRGLQSNLSFLKSRGF